MLAARLITLLGHVNACCIMCVTSDLHGESFQPKQELKGGQGKVELRSFHTKKKKVAGLFQTAVFTGYGQTYPGKETMLLDMWNP